MSDRLSSREAWVAVGAILILVLASFWQSRQLRAVQLDAEKALYAERLRIAQVVLENEMLAAAHLTSPDERTRELARTYLDGSPW